MLFLYLRRRVAEHVIRKKVGPTGPDAPQSWVLLHAA